MEYKVDDKAIERLKKKIILKENSNLKTRTLSDPQMWAGLKADRGGGTMLLKSIKLKNFSAISRVSLLLSQRVKMEKCNNYPCEMDTGKTTFCTSNFFGAYMGKQISRINHCLINLSKRNYFPDKVMR